MIEYALGFFITGMVAFIAVAVDGSFDWISACIILVFAAIWPIGWVIFIMYAIRRGGKHK